MGKQIIKEDQTKVNEDEFGEELRKEASIWCKGGSGLV